MHPLCCPYRGNASALRALRGCIIMCYVLTTYPSSLTIDQSLRLLFWNFPKVSVCGNTPEVHRYFPSNTPLIILNVLTFGFMVWSPTIHSLKTSVGGLTWSGLFYLQSLKTSGSLLFGRVCQWTQFSQDSR